MENHHNAWRPAHIHFSLFGTEFTQRMVTQMYFPGDPLFALDPIYQSITDQRARDRLVATYDHDLTTHEWATGYRWDIVLTGSRRHPLRDEGAGWMSTLTATPGQTVGPFFGYALPYDRDNELVPPGSPGAVRLHGVVTTAPAQPVPDALLEIWQADADGAVPAVTGSLRRDGWTFTGWGRASTDRDGHYSFTTVDPVRHRRAAPFFAVTVFARGLLNRLFTRAYLPGEPLATDPLLASLPTERRATLVAVADEHGFRFDIRLQGDGETVFLRYPGHRQ